MDARTHIRLDALQFEVPSDHAAPPLTTPATTTTTTTTTTTRRGLKRAARRVAEGELKHLAFLSHDINNNLGGVTLHLKLLKQRLALSPGFAEELAVLDRAQQAIEQTTEGMRRLLTYSQLRGHKQTPLLAKPVDLYRLVSDLCLRHAGLARSKGLRIEMDIPLEATVHSDPELIVLVLQNLLGNSVKYSPHGVIGVRFDAVDGPCGDENGSGGSGTDGGDRGGGRRCVLTVSDQGPGIPAALLRQIFRPFCRGDSYGQGGAGLGLVIAAEAAKRLGARLSVQSQVGVGSTFSLSLADRATTAAIEN